jgi:hypothetical protein
VGKVLLAQLSLLAELHFPCVLEGHDLLRVVVLSVEELIPSRHVSPRECTSCRPSPNTLIQKHWVEAETPQRAGQLPQACTKSWAIGVPSRRMTIKECMGEIPTPLGSSLSLTH